MPFEGNKQTEENLGDTTLDYSANGHSDSSSDIKRMLAELGNINRRISHLELTSNVESSAT